jgi:O-succinylhomoserine sulfhydrylase
MTEPQDQAEWALATRAVRVGHTASNHGEQSEALYLTSSFVFRSAAEAAARFGGQQAGNIYSRFTNPTVQAFEARLAALEGGASCVATASGMAAILAVCLGLLKAGDHVVCSRSVFGTTTVLLGQYLPRFGVAVSFVPLADLAAWESAMQPNTQLLLVETPSNPLLELVDIAALAQVAHRHDACLVVDNCIATPCLQRPLALGADIVVHSATKYIDGQGRCLGGAVVGDAERVGKQVYGVIRTAGPSLSPFNAWVFLKGLETLPLRMREHSHNAQQLAEFLTTQPQVAQVYYPGLASHPQHALARTQQQGYGGIVSFVLRGGQAAAWAFIDALKLLSITANLGDAKTTVTHPATTTHGRLSDAQRAEAGIVPGLVRIAAGLEASVDILADVRLGLAAAQAHDRD